MEGGANIQELFKEWLKVPRDPRAKKQLEEIVPRRVRPIDPAAALSC